MNPGIQILTCANVAHLQELSKQENVPVQHQKPNGTPIQKLAVAHQILLVIIVSHVQPQDSGIKVKINAHVQAQKLNGTNLHNSVNVQQESTENIVLNVQLQDFGT